MSPRWKDFVLHDHSFGVPDGKSAELEKLKEVRVGDSLFLYVNGKSGGIIGSFMVAHTEEKDEREACLNFTHRIYFEGNLPLSKPIPFNQFCQKVFPNHYLNNYGQVIRGKSIIRIDDEQAAEYLTEKVRDVKIGCGCDFKGGRLALTET